MTEETRLILDKIGQLDLRLNVMDCKFDKIDQRFIAIDHSCLLYTSPDIENGVLVTRNKILQKNPDAIIAINAFTAMGIMKELRDNGISIPEQIAVSCFDDLEYASILYTCLLYTSHSHSSTVTVGTV